MNYVKRKACSKTVPNFDELKLNFLCDIKEIPPPLIINWDHTSLKYVPSSSWTMAEEGSKCIDVAGIDDKHQITAVLTVTGWELSACSISLPGQYKCLFTPCKSSTWLALDLHP